MPANHRWISASMAVGSLLLLSACEQKNFEALPAIPMEQLEVLGVQTPIKSVHFRDRDGEGLLVLSRSDGQASDPESEQEVDKVVLKATLYGRTAESDAFKARWQIEQETTCPGLDLDVDFYTDVSDVGDLNKDGIAEVTVASHAFCGGGIDPHDIAIEMREGQASYTITGQSLISRRVKSRLAVSAMTVPRSKPRHRCFAITWMPSGSRFTSGRGAKPARQATTTLTTKPSNCCP